MLSAADKLAIARGLLGFARGDSGRDDESVAQWYRRSGQTEGAIRHLWEPLVLATLNDSAENCSMKIAGKVIYELFLKDSSGGRLGIPTVPLSEFYGAVVDLARASGAQFELRASVEQISQRPDGRWLLGSGEREWVSEDVILALPFEQTQRLVTGMQLLDPGAEDARRGAAGEDGALHPLALHLHPAVV